MHSTVFSATPIGIDVHAVHVEVDLSFGMLQFFIVGLPDTAIKESRQRISTALKNSGIRLPERKITVNLAPADLKKEGTIFDLPIAIGILQAGQQINVTLEFLQETLFLGELSLDGGIRPIKGVLPIACDAKKLNKKRLIVPQENAQEAALVEGIEIIGTTNLVQLINHLRNEVVIAPTPPITPSVTQHVFHEDFSQVKGQQQAKRALTIAAAGRHNILFVGPPGAGKTMLAKRLPTIMPPLSFDEIIQTSKIYSITGKLNGKPLITERPFRNPHHTISQAGLVGGGSFPRPGEISLTHNGVLFLDELTEFKRTTLEALRQPLEQKVVCISRASSTITFPASFLLVAALNPCPCGFFGDKKQQCNCLPTTIQKYFEKLSGPLLDRIDLQIHIQSVNYDDIKQQEIPTTSSQDLYTQVCKAVAMQRKRFGVEHLWNGTMPPELIETNCVLTDKAEDLIKRAFEKLGLSMRSYHKTLKIARTIADLCESDYIEDAHIKEALFYRSLDRQQRE